jgi:hypothetical protein
LSQPLSAAKTRQNPTNRDAECRSSAPPQIPAGRMSALARGAASARRHAAAAAAPPPAALAAARRPPPRRRPAAAPKPIALLKNSTTLAFFSSSTTHCRRRAAARARVAAAAGAGGEPAEADFWRAKPAWCQPWSILSTGVAVVGGVYAASGHSIVWTVLASVPILSWWALFLVLVPAAYRQEAEEARARWREGGGGGAGVGDET